MLVHPSGAIGSSGQVVLKVIYSNKIGVTYITYSNCHSSQHVAEDSNYGRGHAQEAPSAKEDVFQLLSGYRIDHATKSLVNVRILCRVLLLIGITAA